MGPSSAWEQLAVLLHQERQEAREQGKEQELGDCLQTIPRAGQEQGGLDLHQLREVERYLEQAVSCTLHPLHR